MIREEGESTYNMYSMSKETFNYNVGSRTESRLQANSLDSQTLSSKPSFEKLDRSIQSKLITTGSSYDKNN